MRVGIVEQFSAGQASLISGAYRSLSYQLALLRLMHKDLPRTMLALLTEVEKAGKLTMSELSAAYGSIPMPDPESTT